MLDSAPLTFRPTSPEDDEFLFHLYYLHSLRIWKITEICGNTRFGAKYIEILLTETGRRLEVVNGVPDDKEDLMTDLASVITSFCARLYGMRRAKRKTEKLIKELQSNGDNETC